MSEIKLLDRVRDTLHPKNYFYSTVQEILGNADAKTTMIYTHVLNKGGRGVKSPLD